ncbi:roadblock/LC7 domain-containing protein [Streptomyces sp. NPDC102274]|uniref:roadblock/LC7 domain-containing protein n=1 Tax=Streptomyces sp. NPDC102274 TaxID=3366151 RepID=UPI003822048E
MTETQNLDWLLKDLTERVPGINAALLSTTDGLARHWYGIDKDQADQLAARACGLVSLGESFGSIIESSGTLRQAILELDDTLAFCGAAGSGSLLTLLTEPGSDTGQIGYEMTQLIKSVAIHLAEPARQSPAEPSAR